MVYCLCVFMLFSAHPICVHVRASGCSSENPIKRDMYWFAVLFKAFWDISSDISFNVRASNSNKLICLSFSPLSSLFLLLLPLHQSFSYTLPFSQFIPLFHHHMLKRCNIFFPLSVPPTFVPSLWINWFLAIWYLSSWCKIRPRKKGTVIKPLNDLFARELQFCCFLF